MMTRTRTYIVMAAGLMIPNLYEQAFRAVPLSPLAGLAATLTIPGVFEQAAQFTRLSSFYSGVDPTSGRTDITNGRGLSSVLSHFIGQHPFSGVGASRVRDEISHLAASSEAGAHS